MSKSFFRMCPRCGNVDVRVVKGVSGMMYQVCGVCGYRVAEGVPKKMINIRGYSGNGI